MCGDWVIICHGVDNFKKSRKLACLNLANCEKSRAKLIACKYFSRIWNSGKTPLKICNYHKKQKRILFVFNSRAFQGSTAIFGTWKAMKHHCFFPRDTTVDNSAIVEWRYQRCRWVFTTFCWNSQGAQGELMFCMADVDAMTFMTGTRLSCQYGIFLKTNMEFIKLEDEREVIFQIGSNNDLKLMNGYNDSDLT